MTYGGSQSESRLPPDPRLQLTRLSCTVVQSAGPAVEVCRGDPLPEPPSAPRPPPYFYDDYREIFIPYFISFIKNMIDAIFMFFLSLRTSASSAVNNSG